MRTSREQGGGRGFTLVELLVVIAIIALLIAILSAALATARRGARQSVCLSNLRQMGTGSASYANDFKEFIYNYSWKATPAGQFLPTEFGDLQTAATDMDAHRNQYVDIFRRRAQRPMEEEATLLPQILYGHFVLMDYLAFRLPEPIYTCPEDAVRQNWARNVDDFIAGRASPYPRAARTPITAGDRDIRWAYSSTYEPTTAIFDPLQSAYIRVSTGPHVNGRIRNTMGNHFVYETSTHVLGLTVYSQVTFPSQKVHLYEAHARHDGPKKQRYYASPGAKVNLLFCDASAANKSNRQANPGWDPKNPASGSYRFNYAPDAWEVPTVSGGPTEFVQGFYRYTRGGLKGVDFGSREIGTGQPNP